MADALSQYALTHAELLSALVKHVGVHEGIWQLQVNFGFAALNAGPNDAELSPAGMCAVQTVGILRVPPETPMTGLMIDAAKANPKS